MVEVRRLGRVLFVEIPMALKLAVYSAAGVWGLIGLKQLEPILYPVVSGFEITEINQSKISTSIAGVLTKRRDCTFKEVIAVSRGRVVSVVFDETAYNTTGVVSRPAGQYDWGWWTIIPRVSHLELYARHDCTTGEVLTEMWEGDLDAVSN